MKGSTQQKAQGKTVPAGATASAPGRRQARKKSRDEGRLLELLKARDPEGFEILMRKYHDKLFSVACRICANHADAEEALQDVYMIAFNKIDRFEQRSSLSTWLYRITVNAALMKRRSQRHSKMMVSMDTVGPFIGHEENAFRSDLQARSPDESLMAKELREKIHKSVENLPEIYQDVFALRDLQGFTIKETSMLLETTPAAIKSRLHRSRFFVKEELRRYLDDN